jgi:hypothetical protein
MPQEKQMKLYENTVSSSPNQSSHLLTRLALPSHQTRDAEVHQATT